MWTKEGMKKIHLKSDFKMQQVGPEDVKDQLGMFLWKIH